MLYKHITELIGNTPIIKLDSNVHGLKNIELYAKLEFYNPFGSVKDRIAWGMIKDDIEDIVKNKKTLIEASSGNTAKALQVLASVFGVKLKTMTNRAKVAEVKQILQLLGADIDEMPGLSECPDPTVPNDVFSTIKNIVERNPEKFYHASQYTNQKNIETHYKTTGKEIFNDVGSVDYFFGGLGTTGSTRGTALYLKKQNKNLKTIGIVSSANDFIPGIRNSTEMWDVGLFDRDFYEKIMEVDSSDAIDATLDLIRKYGILGGPTSGAAYCAVINYLRSIDKKLKKRAKAVFFVCDRVEWYLSYFQKRKPELFGETAELSAKDITDAEIESVSEIELEEADKWIEKNNPLILDTRGNMAFRISHIPNSVNLRDDLLDEILKSSSPFSKSQKILVVCNVGNTSRRFAAFLSRKGYVAASLKEGVTGWKEKGKKTSSLL